MRVGAVLAVIVAAAGCRGVDTASSESLPSDAVEANATVEHVIDELSSRLRAVPSYAR